MRLILVFLIFISCICSAQGFLIQGTIKDSLDGHSLPYATIKVENSPQGTMSDENGKFVITADSTVGNLEISLIGYQKKSIKAIPGNVSSFVIRLVPQSYETATIEVPPLTWAEKFILNSINKNIQDNARLEYFKADAYSKTIFSQKNEQIIGLIESISELHFQRPEKFQEKVIALKIPPHMKNLPYSSISINQQINLNDDYLKIQNMYFISPLSKDAFKYYDYSLRGRTKSGTESIVIISILPKTSNRPLFEGQLTFNEKTSQLLEADLQGNEWAKTSIFDSIKLSQKYQILDSLFNLPVFSKCEINMNCASFKVNFTQEYTITNYKINDVNNQPLISTNSLLIENTYKDWGLNSKSDTLFKVPLSLSERQHNTLIDSVFFKTSFLKKALLFTVIQFPSLLLDKNSNIGNLAIRHFSSWYHFNKAEGHYLGFEFNGYNDEQSSLILDAGYGFSSHLFLANLLFNWEYFNLKLCRSVNNLGEFSYNKNFHTINALINHEDSYSYYISHLLKLNFVIPVARRITMTPYLQFEKQQPVETLDEFSLFNQEKLYTRNITITPYNSNKTGLKISFNREFADDRFYGNSTLVGQSFTDAETQLEWSSRKLLNSGEDNYNFTLLFHRHQEVNSTLNLDLSLFFQKQSATTLIQNFSFVSSVETEKYNNSALSFFTTENYQYCLSDFFRIKAEANLYKLPEFLNLRMTVGTVYSFLRPLNVPIITDFPVLENNFQEFGISLKGISIINLYLLKNSLSNKNFYFRFSLGV